MTPPGAIPAGVWLCAAYGWVLDVGAGGYARWQLAAGGAYLEERGSPSDLERGLDRVTLEGDRLTLYHRGEITPYVFVRQDALPRACAQPYASADPIRTFDAVAAIFRDHYAFFAERGVDWDAACAEHRSRIGTTTGRDALFDALTTLLEPLRDNHVSLDTQPSRSLFDETLEALPGGCCEPGAPGDEPRSWKCDRIAALRARIARGLGVDVRGADFWAAMKALQPIVARDLLGGRGHSACNGLLHWATSAAA